MNFGLGFVNIFKMLTCKNQPQFFGKPGYKYDIIFDNGKKFSPSGGIARKKESERVFVQRF